MFEPYRCFDSLVEGWDFVSAQVEPDGETATLFLRKPKCWFPRTTRLVILSESSQWEIDFPHLERDCSLACRIGQDRLLLWSANGKPNAYIYDLDGRLLHEISLGAY